MPYLVIYSLFLYKRIKTGIMLPDTLQQIGVSIRKRRDVLKITQDQLSMLSGVAVRTIRELEQGSGNPSLETVDKLFNELGLEIKVGVQNKGLPTIGLTY
jgi:transcriptional regulator with XRE-family HTH domain